MASTGLATVVISIALVAGAVPAAFAEGATDEDCDTYRRECIDARAVGSPDAGICTVVRLECANAPDDATAGTGKDRPRAPLRRPTGVDRERSTSP